MAVNPYTASAKTSEPRPKPPSRFSATELVVVIVVIAVLLALLLPATRSARPAAYRMQCSNNLKAIALALHNYAAHYDALPPAYSVDADGKPLHSWRTLILPFLEHQALYDQIDLTKPWDDPVHARLAQAQPMPYRCPATSISNEQTTYLAVVGPQACLHPTSPRPLSDILDGLSNTIMLVEVASDHAVHWMSPQDAFERLDLQPGPDAALAHSGGTNVAFADGSIQFLPATTSESARRALITISAGDAIE